MELEPQIKMEVAKADEAVTHVPQCFSLILQYPLADEARLVRSDVHSSSISLKLIHSADESVTAAAAEL